MFIYLLSSFAFLTGVKAILGIQNQRSKAAAHEAAFVHYLKEGNRQGCSIRREKKWREFGKTMRKTSVKFRYYFFLVSDTQRVTLQSMEDEIDKLSQAIQATTIEVDRGKENIENEGMKMQKLTNGKDQLWEFKIRALIWKLH